MTNSIAEIADAKCIFAIGTNTTEDHPVIALEIKKAVDKGAKLIVADPREIGLCRWAHIWLRHRPGTDVALLMGMCRVILDEGLLDKAFVEQRCENFEEFKNSLKASTSTLSLRLPASLPPPWRRQPGYMPPMALPPYSTLWASRSTPTALTMCWL